MKIILIYLTSLSSLAYSKNIPEYFLPEAPLPLEAWQYPRQPFISPEQDALLDNYKRFKRREEDSNDSVVVPIAVQRFQEFLDNCKGQCAHKMGFTPNEIEKSFLYEENPTDKEKCLMACVLERTKIMDDSNKVSVDTISRLASMISNNNELIIAIAKATAENCNRSLNPANKCEAAFQINRCIAQGLKNHKIHIVY